MGQVPVALLEEDGRGAPTAPVMTRRVLLFREGLLDRDTLACLDRLLRHL